MLDLLYARAAGARRLWYERHPQARRRLCAPAISVGNLSVGGTGKTPLVAQIAQWLIAQGERPAILSRGYKRRDRDAGVTVVSDGRAALVTVHAAGDEPLMLARAVPQAIVVVCEDRHLAGVVAERRLGATVHLLDDGFQHVQLARDLDILVTVPGEITSGRVLPFGRLREARGAAARADLVVVVDADEATARGEAWELGISQFAAASRLLTTEGQDFPGPSAVGGRSGGTSDALLAVAGIAHPDRFFAMLRASGASVAETLAFSDHHAFTTGDIARIADRVRQSGVSGVITTAKDAVRFEPHAPLPFTLRVAALRLDVQPWSTVTAAIVQALSRAREAA